MSYVQPSDIVQALIHVYAANITLSCIIKIGAVVFFTPVFLIPAVFIAAFGGWLGSVYIKAQLSVKREMSNAKAPVLGVFGGAIAGLSESSGIP